MKLIPCIHYLLHKLNIVFFQSPDADLMVRPAEVRRLESKGQNRNELHESESWSKACCVSVDLSITRTQQLHGPGHLGVSAS